MSSVAKRKTEQMSSSLQWVTHPVYSSHVYRFSAVTKVITASSWFIHVTFPCYVLLLSFPQVFRPYCQSTCGPGLCRQLSATSVVMRRASLCVGTMTAGVSAPWTTHSVIAPRWIWRHWNPVCWKSEIRGTWPTKTLRSQVSVSLFALIQWLWPSHWQQIRPYC